MERFVFVAAVTIAILFGAFYLIGARHGFHHGHGFSIDFDDSNPTDPVIAVAAGHTAPQTYAATSIELRHLAAHILVTPEDRTDISIEIESNGHAPMPGVTLESGKVVVDGHLGGRIGHCNAGGARLRGYGEFVAADLPHIIVHAPRALVISASGGATTEIGAAESVDADFSGCGDSQVGDVAGLLHVDLAGSGDLHAGAAHGFELSSAGAGDVFTGAVTDNAKIEIAGASDVTIASLHGSLSSESAGAGDLTIQGGALTTASIEMAGAGSTRIGAPIERLKVEIVGASNVEVTATVGDIDAEIAGPGTVRVQAATGTVRREIMGPGRVEIGH